jgi:predicted phage terminase large subunit-like protein
MSAARSRAFIGGVGSGKTMAGCAEVFRPDYANTTGAFVAPTFPMLRDATLRTFLGICDVVAAQGWPVLSNFNKGDMVAELTTGTRVLFRSADNPERLRGPNLGFFYLDEAALMPRKTWDIMLGRLREKPGRAWLTTTPRGFNWIYDLFVTQQLDGYDLIRSSSRDNPYLPTDFIGSLEQAYAGQFRQQEIEGEFVQPEGALAQRDWFGIVDAVPQAARRVRFWDFAATEKKLTSDDPDFTAGVKLAYFNGVFYVEHVIQERLDPAGVDRLVLQTAQADGRDVEIGLEQEPGASGKSMAAYMIRLLAGYNVRAIPASGDKVMRAMPWLAQAQAGNVKLLRGAWNADYLDEVTMFPVGAHDDMVDSTSGAFTRITTAGGPIEQGQLPATLRDWSGLNA